LHSHAYGLPDAETEKLSSAWEVQFAKLFNLLGVNEEFLRNAKEQAPELSLTSGAFG